MHKLLVIEDDPLLSDQLQCQLQPFNYRVDLAADGQTGWELANQFDYDLIVLDWILPTIDGIHICERLRSRQNTTPILLLTAQSTMEHKVQGFQAGADDYLSKPFDWRELHARVQALIRRSQACYEPIVRRGNLQLDPQTYQAIYRNSAIVLTHTEFDFLELFMRHPMRVFPIRDLLDRFWSLDDAPNNNTIRTHIKHIRQKLQKIGAVDVIETLHGIGYRLKELPILASESSSQFNEGLDLTARLWEKHRDRYQDRLHQIQQVIVELTVASAQWVASSELQAKWEQVRSQIDRDAHTLAGSLGSFGRVAAADYARQLQALTEIHDWHLVDPSRLEWLANQVAVAMDVPIATPNPQSMPVRDRRSLRMPGATPDPSSFPGPLLPELSTQLPTQLPAQLFPAHLLIVDDDAALASLMAETAKAYGLTSTIAHDLTEARQILQQNPPHIVLLDLEFPGSDAPVATGLRLLSELAQDYPDIAIVIFTAHADLTHRMQAAQLGKHLFISKANSPTQVMRSLQQSLAQWSQMKATVLGVGFSPETLQPLSALLQPWGIRLLWPDSLDHVWSILESTHPDLIILSTQLPTGRGLHLCQAIHNDPQWQSVPILVASDASNPTPHPQICAVGAAGLLPWPIAPSEWVTQIVTCLQASLKGRSHPPLSLQEPSS